MERKNRKYSWQTARSDPRDLMIKLDEEDKQGGENEEA
ncbi:hypothetical protein SAMN05421788_106199 [Filimonas lacunae]|uniref:Uncharacterized protein n=1 Tax=Filimonas lacunae TaxID=477680 RepID=A0A173MF72_9BACT|nr:hypothetical protein FLA_2154 [Filimonas lacunae]SIT24841.1 hypothetical protein SAMN05421788_106199 [Filimonas lacunae]